MEYNIFNSLIWKSQIEYDKKYELISTIEENYKKNPNQTPRGWNCSLHSSFNQKQTIPETFKDSLLNKIEEKFKEFLTSYEKLINIDGDYVTSHIWYNAYKGNQFQEPHIHGSSIFSGCYYLKFNEEVHHQTEFYNPNFDLDYSKLEKNKYFSRTFNCKEDDIIIFPSCLKHGTKGIKSKDKCEEIRITISFNMTNYNVCHLIKEIKEIKETNITYQ